MCGIVLLIAVVLYAARIPGLLRSTPSDFPGCDPAVHAQWKSKSLRTIYVFLGGVGALALLTFGAALAVVIVYSNDQEAQSTAGGIAMGISMLATLAVLIWAMIIERQALKLKKALMPPGNLPPTYYPRPGQRIVPMPSAEPSSPEPDVARATDLGDQIL